MKTKNNVQKTILKMLAAITGLFLLTYTVGAQDSFKDLLASNSLGAIAKVITENSASEYNFTDLDDEPTLELEEWMTNGDFFNLNAFTIENETEKPLEVEDWMLNDDIFSTPETEKPLKLEIWMIAGSLWN